MDEFAKVAALLSHLDAGSRAEILRRLPTDIRTALEERGAAAPLSQHELVQVVAEFQALLRGIDSDSRLEPVCEIPGDSHANPGEEADRSTGDLARLILEPTVTTARVAELLAGERCETIAGIVSHFPEAAAVEVFAKLPEDRRQATLPLLPKTGPLTPLVLDEIQQCLAEQCRPAPSRNSSGMSLLARLLNSRESGISDVTHLELSPADQELLKRLGEPR